jgi:ArsR family transcriptional regulator, lead/cadmium/zinc/bismuth-responsive transcriptional repressor
MPDNECELLCLDLPRAEAIRAQQLTAADATGAAALAKALGDPTRLTVADALREGGELCGCDLAWITGHSQKLVSHHLTVLRAAGLTRSRREGKIVFHELTASGTALLGAVLASRGVPT